MGLALFFFGLALVGVACIVLAVWDFFEDEKAKERQVATRGTMTRMTSGRTGYVIITYDKEGQ
jgi:hypothetical protein